GSTAPGSTGMGGMPERRLGHGQSERKDLPEPLVRQGGGGGGQVLYIHLSRFAGRPYYSADERVAERTTRLREGGRLHDLGPAIPGDERGAAPRVQRRHLDGRALRGPGRAGPLLERSSRRRRESAGVRLAHRPVRSEVADRSCPPRGDDAGGSGSIEEGHGRAPEDGEARHRVARKSVPLVSGARRRPVIMAWLTRP